MSAQTTRMSLPNNGLRCKRFDARSDSGPSQIALATALRNIDYFTAAMNLGKYLSHWIVVAWSEGATGHVVDYGQIEVASEDQLPECVRVTSWHRPEKTGHAGASVPGMVLTE